MLIIPVCFTFDKNFVLPAAVALYSLLEYADKRFFYKLYVFHIDIPYKEQIKLQKIISHFEKNSSLEFIDVKVHHSNQNWKRLNSKQHYSQEIYNKLIIPDLLPQYDKIICSDVDVVFQGDISPSYFMYSENDLFYVAGICGMFEPTILDWYQDFSREEKEILRKSIGAGYMLLNLKRMRKDNMPIKMTEFYKQNLSRLIQPEQDVINICCASHIQYLPYKYMVCAVDYKYSKKNACFRTEISNPREVLVDGLENPIQLHYSGFLKPWNSFFIPKQDIWFCELFRSGFAWDYVTNLPLYLYRRSKKYSIMRFVKKTKKKTADLWGKR